jgi:hypothetical protein
MVNPIRLEIKSNKIAAGRSDVVINDPSLSNALLRDSASVLLELQKSYGSTVSLDEIEVDHNGAVVISNPALAKAMRARLADPGSLAANVNVFCGNIKCGPVLEPGEDRIIVDRSIVDRLERIERRLGS